MGHGQAGLTNTAPYLGSQAREDLWRPGRLSLFSGAQASVMNAGVGSGSLPPHHAPLTGAIAAPGHPVSLLVSLPQKNEDTGTWAQKSGGHWDLTLPRRAPAGLCRPYAPARPLALC